MKEINRLEKMLTEGKISRRDFLTRVSALGLTFAIAPGLIPKQALASDPQKGGRLRIGISGGATSDTLDPALISDVMPATINNQIRNNLVEVDHKMFPKPELAESWEASQDAKKWVFKLRKGVEFHNGKTFEAEDAIYSINYHLNENTKSPAKAILKDVLNIEADGKYAIIFHLKEGNADFPSMLTVYNLTMFPTGTKDFSEGIGTGGYILESYEPGVRCFVKRNPNYWKAGRAHFDEVETIAIADVNARTVALKTGKVDVINRCDAKTFHLLEKTLGIQGVVTTGFQHYEWAMLCDRAPFDNNDARLAMKYAIDRELMLQQLLRGYGLLGNDHPISPTNRYYNIELPQRQYDPDKANYHLKKAGLEGYTFEIFGSEAGFPGALDATALFQEQAKKSGIKIKIVKYPSDGYWREVWMKKSMCAVYWTGRLTADQMFSTAYAADAPWNDTKWTHERFNNLLIEARSEMNDSKRREMYYEMQKIVHNQGGALIFAFASDLAAATDKLKYETLSGDKELDGGRLSERWWFAS